MFLWFIFFFLNAPAFAQSAHWIEVEIGIIGPASDEILADAMALTASRGAAGLLVKLDTPGGSLESTRSMVKRLLNSDFPVVVWVGPSGARAGSAGAFITLAANVATMANGTNIGAAHPVAASGDNVDGPAGKKIENDTIAFIESIAKMRKRNEEVAVSFVMTSLSLTAQEALEQNVIEVIADSPNELFEKLNGREVSLADEKNVVLATKDYSLEPYEKTLRQKFLEILSNPNLFYLLFIGGLIGLGVELTHPGVMMPGVLGAISLILSLMSSSVLPVNFGAMILVVASIAFLVAEIFVPSFGVLGIGGLVGFVTGSFLLLDTSEDFDVGISLGVILPVAVFVLALFLAISYFALRSKRSRVVSGREGMVGLKGAVLSDFREGAGRVMVSGENWSAVSANSADLKKDQKIEVCEIREGLELLVKASDDPHLS